jgi:hypothetical protein
MNCRAKGGRFLATDENGFFNAKAQSRQVARRRMEISQLPSGCGWGKFCFTHALILAFSPGEKELPARVFSFAEACPANPVAGFSEAAADVSPSP